MKFIQKILLFLGGVICTEVFHKAFDCFFDVIKEKRRIEKMRRRNEQFLRENHDNIKVLVDVFPHFQPKNIKTRIIDEKAMYLALPNCVKKKMGQECKNFSDTDLFFSKISIPGIDEDTVRKNLEEARLLIAKKFLKRTDGMYFNGKQFGVVCSNGFSRQPNESEDPILRLEFFKTDYFTHQVIAEMIKISGVDRNLITYNNLNGQLKWMRTSIGLSIIVLLRATNEIILTKRSPNAAYSDGIGWIYVSATETLSRTDVDAFSKQVDIQLCLKRGLEEELGITEDMYYDSTIKFYEQFFETNFFQDGIIASVEIKDEVTFDYIKKCRAKDKQLEIDDLILIDNNALSINKYIEKNYANMRSQTVFALKSYAARL